MAKIGNFSEYVTIRCNDCGKEWCFFPMRCKFPPECDCGNKDSGRPTSEGWWADNFGNFTLVKREDWNIRMPFFAPLYPTKPECVAVRGREE